MDKLTEANFTMQYDGEHSFPFIELSDGYYLVGFGHIDREAFASAATEYDKLCAGSFWAADEAWRASDVQHLHAIQAPSPSSDSDEWIIQWAEADEADAFPITRLAR